MEEIYANFQLRLGRLLLIRLRLLASVQPPPAKIVYEPEHMVHGLLQNALVEFRLVDGKARRHEPYMENVRLLRGKWIQEFYEHLCNVRSYIHSK